MNNSLKITLFVFLLISVALIVSILSLQLFLPRQNIKLAINNMSNNAPDQGTKMEDKVLSENQATINRAQAQTNNHILPIAKDDNDFGASPSKVQMIVYSDFECPFCADFSGALKKVRDKYKDKIYLAFRHFPLLSHSNALPAAMAAECAAEQGKFWPMHDLIFADNKNDKMGTEQYNKDAKSLNLNMVEFSQCFETEKYKNKIEEQMLSGRNGGVTGTPTIFINDEIYPGALPFEDFTTSDGRPAEGLKSIIERLLK
jgi:protein-disulfide isomerase